jgi:hypothetical protein
MKKSDKIKLAYEVVITGGEHKDKQGAIHGFSVSDKITVLLHGQGLMVDVPCKWVELSKEQVFAGFTKNELMDAFDLVKPKANWKEPIDAIITEDKQEVVDSAIAFFTGGGADYCHVKSVGQMRVTAPGYYVMIGA